MEEIYLSADGLYEYSVAEINAAAARDKVTFEEFIASKGMKLKGDEVEQTIELYIFYLNSLFNFITF